MRISDWSSDVCSSDLTSSIVAYGIHGGTITEDTPTRASTDGVNYVRSKALAEREVRKGISAGLPAVIVNPSNIIGPYDTASWSRLFRLVRQGRLPAIDRKRGGEGKRWSVRVGPGGSS